MPGVVSRHFIDSVDPSSSSDPTVLRGSKPIPIVRSLTVSVEERSFSDPPEPDAKMVLPRGIAVVGLQPSKGPLEVVSRGLEV